MARRSKNNTSWYQRRIDELFKEFPESQDVKNRYKSLVHILVQKYPKMKEVGSETMMAILFDADFLNRRIRWLTEGKETKLKKQLSQEYQVDLDYQIKQETLI